MFTFGDLKNRYHSKCCFDKHPEPRTKLRKGPNIVDEIVRYGMVIYWALARQLLHSKIKNKIKNQIIFICRVKFF